MLFIHNKSLIQFIDKILLIELIDRNELIDVIENIELIEKNEPILHNEKYMYSSPRFIGITFVFLFLVCQGQNQGIPREILLGF